MKITTNIESNKLVSCFLLTNDVKEGLFKVRKFPWIFHYTLEKNLKERNAFNIKPTNFQFLRGAKKSQRWTLYLKSDTLIFR